MGPLYALDIETDTTIDGRDPSVAAVIAVSIADAEGPLAVLTGPEPMVLRATIAALDALEPGIVATWNGAGFDIPFIQERCDLLGIPTGWTVTPTDRPSKYPPIGERSGRYSCVLGRHNHADIAWGWQAYCAHNSVTWSLKPLAHSLGIEAIEADREHAAELLRDELFAYVASDAHVTAVLAQRLGEAIGDHLD
jgi:DNA polymerase elongation subunit (family B)